MNACAGCGRPARAFVAWLLAVPVVIGLAGAGLMALSRGTSLATPALVATGVAFAVFAAWAGRFGLRVWSGQACAACGRSLPVR